MAGFSIIYLFTAFELYTLGFGDTSLVYANIINLLARIGYALCFISSYFGSRGAVGLLRWKEVLPTPPLILSSILSTFVIHYYGQQWGIPDIVKAGGRMALLNIFVVMHVGLGGSLALICTTIWWIRSGCFLVSSDRMKIE